MHVRCQWPQRMYVGVFESNALYVTSLKKAKGVPFFEQLLLPTMYLSTNLCVTILGSSASLHHVGPSALDAEGSED